MGSIQDERRFLHLKRKVKGKRIQYGRAASDLAEALL
jgi:hypothetical protein